MKECSMCNLEKDFTEFNKQKTGKDGLISRCKICTRKVNEKYRGEKDAIRCKEWREKNVEKCKKYRYEYYKNRYNNDKLFRLTCNIRNMINNKFKNKGHNKKSKTCDILGCSFIDFKLYLESKFEPWMNWDNYGKYNGEFDFGWDIDHILPASNGITEDEIIKLNHYTNLQPLCSKINRDIKINNIRKRHG